MTKQPWPDALRLQLTDARTVRNVLEAFARGLVSEWLARFGEEGI